MRLFFVLVLTALLSGPASAQALDLSKKSKAVTTKGIKLTAAQKKCVGKYWDGVFYASIFVSPGAEACRAITNASSVNDARVLAKAGCEARREPTDPPCIEYSYVLRKTKAGLISEGLPVWAVIALKQTYGKRHKHRNMFVAVATAGVPIGELTIELTPAIAQELALKRCNAKVREVIQRVGNDETAAAKRNRLLSCKVRHVSQVK